MNTRRFLSQTFGQLARYGLSGLVINGLLYGLYLGLAWFGMLPWHAATICFAAGIPLSYATHRRYTFQNAQSSALQKLMFTVAYISAYFLQISGLYLLYSIGEIPHQLAQITMMVVVALWLFFVQKFLIFRGEK